MFVIPNNIKKQIRMITRFRGIQEKVRNSSCKHVDEKSANGLPLEKSFQRPCL